MDLVSVLESRRQTFLFNDNVPSKAMINEILDAVHQYAPSKQNRIRYNIEVYRNDDPEKRMKIYEAGKSSPVRKDARHNPQLLAPWLLFLSNRDVKNQGHSMKGFVETEPNEIPSEGEIGMDIGLAASYIILKAIDMGLNYGYCACITKQENFKGIVNDYNSPRLIISLGYRNDAKGWICPVYNKWEPIVPQTFKPEKYEYIRYI